MIIIITIMTIIGLGPQVYFQDPWNRMDFIIVIGSIAVLILYFATSNDVGLVVNVIRVGRIARAVRLMKGFPTLDKLIDTIILTIPGVFNISILLILFIYIFSIIGVSLFATVGYNGSYNNDANFRTFPIAFLTLIRFTTVCGIIMMILLICLFVILFIITTIIIFIF